MNYKSIAVCVSIAVSGCTSGIDSVSSESHIENKASVETAKHMLPASMPIEEEQELIEEKISEDESPETDKPKEKALPQKKKTVKKQPKPKPKSKPAKVTAEKQPESKPEKPESEKKPEPAPKIEPKPKKPEPKIDIPDSADIFPEIYAPVRYKHPLRDSKNLNFMIGEDDEGTYLYGEGPIIEGAFEKFIKYVEHYNNIGIELDRIMIHSPGGLLNEGIAIGNYIRDNKWTTDADRYMKCYSTCGFIYASGVEKRIQKGAEIGFHRPYLPDVPDTKEFIKTVYKKYQGYWRYIEGDENLYNKFMIGYGRDDMLILNTRNIERYMTVDKY